MIGMGPTAVEAGTLDLDPFPYTNCGLKRWAERPIHNVGNTVYRLSDWAMRTAARVPGLARGEQLGKGPRHRPPRAAGSSLATPPRTSVSGCCTEVGKDVRPRYRRRRARTDLGVRLEA